MSDDRTLRTSVEIDGEAHDVEVQLPDGYLSPEEVRENYVLANTVSSRIKRAVSGRHTVDEVAENEELLMQIIAQREDWLREHLAIEGDKPDVSKLHDQWRATELAPINEKLEALANQNDGLRRAKLRAAVNGAAAELGVKKSQLPLLSPFYRDLTKWDDEYEDWFVVNPATGEFEFSGDPDAGKSKPPYLTVSEDLERKYRSGEYADWFDGKGRPGSDYQGGGRTPRSGKLSVDEFKAMDGLSRRKLYDDDPDLYRRLVREMADQSEQELARRHG